MNFYVSFGQAHTHSFNGLTLDKDCLLAIEADSGAAARQHAFEWFGAKWSGLYNEDALRDVLPYFPRGIVKANP